MEEFRICPQCGYARGFHVSFRKDERGIRVILVCPDCGSAYDPGIIVTGMDMRPERTGEYPEKQGP